MSQSFVIEGQLPSLNEYIRAERSTKYAAATMKHSWQNYIIAHIVKAKVRKAAQTKQTCLYTLDINVYLLFG